MEFTKDSQVFANKYNGIFDTPKKLNRSNNVIQTSYIDKIEGGEITSTDILEISKIVPVFTYKTCLTIHGNLPEIERTRIGGYKNIIQNGNGSLEIRYSAIDYQIKKDLSKYLIGEYNRQENSTHGIYFDKSVHFEDKAEALKCLNEQVEYVNSFEVEGLKAKIFVNGYSYFGRYYIITTIMPLIITHIPVTIAAGITGKSIEVLQAEYDIRMQEETARQDKWKEESLRREQAKEKLNSEKEYLFSLLSSSFKEQPINREGIYITVTQTITGKAAFKFIVTTKGTFGRYSYKSHLNEICEYDESKLKEAMKGKQCKPNEIATGKTFILS